MKAKLLNLPNGLRLAAILSKYIDKETNIDAPALDFIAEILNRITPEEFLQSVILLTGETRESVEKEIPIDILTYFVEGLQQNQILSLVSFCDSLGLK